MTCPPSPSPAASAAGGSSAPSPPAPPAPPPPPATHPPPPPDHPPSAPMPLAGGVWLTLRAARIGKMAPTDERDIAVSIESTSPAERMALFVRACGLSSRETALLTHLVTGIDTRSLAQRMFLSEHTVQDHLKSIFTQAR